MIARLAMYCGCLAACDRAFDLEPLYVPEHYGQIVNDPERDFDADGEPNATDLCVAIPATEIGGRDDRDMDGVGDLCDPHPDMPGDCLALFDSFENPELSAHWRFSGEQVVLDSDRLTIPGGSETLVYLDTPLDLYAVEVTGYVHIGANAPGDRHAVQVLLSSSRSPRVSGRACSADSDGVTSRVAIVDVMDGADTIDVAQEVGDNLIAAGTTFSLAWRPSECSAELFDGDNQSATVAGAPPPGGVFMLRVLDAGVWVRSIAGYGRGCL